MEFFFYNLRVAILVAAFFSLYKLFLSRDTFFRFNRIILLSIAFLSFALPCLHLSVSSGSSAHAVVAKVANVVVLDKVVVGSNDDTIGWLDPYFIAILVFFSGVFFCAVRYFATLWRVVAFLRRGESVNIGGGVTLVLHDARVAPFSWLQCVSMSRTDYECGCHDILIHELAHVRCWHSLDLLVLNLLRCFQWFNPAMWLLVSEMTSVHEYEADQAGLNSGADAKQYQMLLIQKAAGEKWCSVANSFNNSELKKRISMMLKKKSSAWAKAKVLFALPIVGCAVSAFARVSSSERAILSQAKSEDSFVELAFEAAALDNQPVSVASPSDALVAECTPLQSALVPSLAASEISDIANGDVAVSAVAPDFVADDAVSQADMVNVEASHSLLDSTQSVAGVGPYMGVIFLNKTPSVYAGCEQMPEFPMGSEAIGKFIRDNINYPQEAKQNGIYGCVFVQFVVDPQGDVVDVHAVRPFNEFLDAEAVRVISSMPRWTPGRHEGRDVAVSFIVPVSFVLPADEENEAGDKIKKTDKVRRIRYY